MRDCCLTTSIDIAIRVNILTKMGSDKKDLEIIYNLEWKNASAAQKDKSNIVGMYDIPSTTLNWETFKSYLLKNSGAGVDDVKVSYVRSDDKEFPIESQLDFQIALYSFRQRARNDEVITLRLDRVCDHKAVGSKRQRQNIEDESFPVASISDDIPAWFKKFMKGYKKDLVDEVTTSVVNAMSNAKQASTRKSKETSTKRCRKSGESCEKESRKTLKLERKIEELEEKTNKMKEKKLEMIRAAERHENSDTDQVSTSTSEMLLDAAPVGPGEVKVSHMVGGQIFRQEWLVRNTGSTPWTVETDLRYAWGSEALRPLEKVVGVPLLKPGEKGTVIVLLEVPSVPGKYECYWHFAHSGRRFGQWLGCQLTVDPTPIKLISVHRYDPVNKSITVESSAVSWSAEAGKSFDKETDTSVAAVATTFDDLTIVCSDSDNQSIVSVADSNSSAHSARTDGFVVVPIETETEVEVKVEPKQKSGYAYVTIDGKKHAVPKGLLRKDFLESAEDAPPPEGDQKRLFVFPLNCPGFEVVYPPTPMSMNITHSNKFTTEVEAESAIEKEPTFSVLLKVEDEEEKPNISPLANDVGYTNHRPLYPNCTVPMYPPPLSVPPITIPATPITIPVAAPPPRTIAIPPTIFAYNSPSNPNQGWYYSPRSTAAPQYAHCGPPPNSNFGYPYVQAYTFTTSDGFVSQPPPPQNAGTPYEGDEPPTSSNNEPSPDPLRIIPETFVSGAVNVASSAINTARSVLNMFTATGTHAQPMPSAPQAQTMPPQSPAQPMPSPPQARPMQQQQATPRSPQVGRQPPQEGVQASTPTPRERAHLMLRAMGFWDRHMNESLLDRFHDDVPRVVAELVM